MVLTGLSFSLTGCVSPRASLSQKKGLLDPKPSQALSRISSDLTQETVIGVKDPFPFVWPLRFIHVTSPFGQRGRRFHEGVDLRASRGTPVFAAKSGQVIYSDHKIRGYGNMIVIRHDSGLSTVSAHHSKNLVRRGARVNQGQLIALSGGSGRSRGEHLHFEIRKGLAALDPQSYLSIPVILAQGRAPLKGLRKHMRVRPGARLVAQHAHRKPST